MSKDTSMYYDYAVRALQELKDEIWLSEEKYARGIIDSKEYDSDILIWKHEEIDISTPDSDVMPLLRHPIQNTEH